MRDGCGSGKVEHPHGLRFNHDALLLSLVTAALMLTEPPAAQRIEVPQAPDVAAPRPTSRELLRRYLTRPVARSARFLDHGVIGAAVGLGVPHLYRVELSVGVLDHLTLGATAHWLSGQAKPQWTPKLAVARRLALVWGVHAVLCHDVADVPEISDLASITARREGFGEAGQTIVISAGMPFGVSGTTNLLRIAQIH